VRKKAHSVPTARRGVQAKKFYAHDEKERGATIRGGGGLVRPRGNSFPLSKLKLWRLKEILFRSNRAGVPEGSAVLRLAQGNLQPPRWSGSNRLLKDAQGDGDQIYGPLG